ncbi:MAG: MgtC/SapB family protein [Deinococcales bacterium]
MTTTEGILAFLVAVLIGFLIGLERERKRETTGSIFAGIRTFPLISLFGATIGYLSLQTGFWLIAAGLIALSSLLVLSYWRASSGIKIGGTTEIAALVAFSLGTIAGLQELTIALAGGVIVTGILSLRDELRVLSGGLSRADLFAVVQFAAVSLVILPLIPNQNFGPWGVWNPHQIWLLVVLISGVSFVGYVLSKLISTEKSIGLSGFIGGIASSTAVTLSFSERSKTYQELSQMFAAGVLAATAISMLRLLTLIAIISPNLAFSAAPSFLSYCVVSAVGGYIIYRLNQHRNTEGAKLNNPFELKTALSFALFFALILLLTKAAQVFLGDQGTYLASFLSGFSQLDAISLTLAREVKQAMSMNTATQALTLALIGNSIFKVFMAFSLGSRVFAKSLLWLLLLSSLAALVALYFIPSDYLSQWFNGG